MAAEDRILKILLQLKADTADKEKVTGALKEVRAEAEKTAGAVQGIASTGSLGQRITDTTAIQPAVQSAEETAAIAARNAELEKGFAIRQAAAGAQIKEIALSEEATISEAKKALQMERQVIVELQLEAAEAKIAGDNALAAKLEREADIRFRALSIQRALNVSTEEAIVLAERMIIAQETTATATGLVGANLGKAKAEALVLAREIATSSVNARTVGSLMGSLGGSITVASIAGFELFQFISHAADEALRLANETKKASDELQRQVTHWNEVAAAAGSLGDVVKLGDQIQPELQKLSDRLAELRARELDGWQKIADIITKIFGSAIPGHGPQFNQEQLDAARKSAELQERAGAVAGAMADQAARKAKEAWESIKLGPLNEGIAKQNALVEEARQKYESLLSERQKVLSGNLDDAAVQRLIQLNSEITKTGQNLELQTKRTDELSKTFEKLSATTEGLAQKEQDASFSKLDPDRRLEAYAERVREIQAEIEKLGIDAPTPQAVIEALKTETNLLVEQKLLTADQVEEVQKLVALWQQTNTAITKTKSESSETRRQTASDKLNASLRQQQTELQNIRQQQELINANPFLSPDTKQALTLASLTAEYAKLSAARKEAEINFNSPIFDESQHERLRAQLQADDFELKKIRLQMDAINKPVAAELASWVHSFGTSAHQIGQLIEGSITASLQGLNSLLADSIFRTGDWKKALVGVEEQIFNLFLTFAEQQLLNFLFGEGLKRASTATSVQQGAETAVAHAPGAAAVSIESFGASAIIGTALALAGIGAIIALLSGGFKKGGYTGAGGADEYAGPAHKGEYIFPKDVTDTIGVASLQAVHRGDATIVPHYADGGRVGFADGVRLPTPLPPPLPIATIPRGTPTTYYGPGIGEHWHDATHGASDRPLRAGDAALSPDLASRMGLHYGDYFVYNGQTYRYADASYIRPGVPNKNTVEIWVPPSGGAAQPQQPDAPETTSSSSTSSSTGTELVEGTGIPVEPDFLPGADAPVYIGEGGHIDINAGDDTIRQSGFVEITPGIGPRVPGGSPPPFDNPEDAWVGLGLTPQEMLLARQLGYVPGVGPFSGDTGNQRYLDWLATIMASQGGPRPSPGQVRSGGDVERGVPIYNSSLGIYQMIDDYGNIVDLGPGAPPPVQEAGGAGGSVAPGAINATPFYEPRQGQPLSLGPGGMITGFPGYTGMEIIGHDTMTGMPVYRDPSTGRLYVPPGTGTPIGGVGGMVFDYTSGHMVPVHSGGPSMDVEAWVNAQTAVNDTGNTGDEGHTIYPLRIGERKWVYNPETGSIEQTGEIYQGPHGDMSLTAGMTPEEIAYARQLLAMNFSGTFPFPMGGGGGGQAGFPIPGQPIPIMPFPEVTPAPAGSGSPDDEWDRSHSFEDWTSSAVGGGGAFGDVSGSPGGFPEPPAGGQFGEIMEFWHGTGLHAAMGMRLPGSPSRRDTIPAMLAEGEVVLPAHTVAGIDSLLGGKSWTDKLADPDALARMIIPISNSPSVSQGIQHFADGGRVGGGSSGSSSSTPGRGRGPDIKIINVLDMKAVAREALKDSTSRIIVVDHVKNSVHELGLPATN